MSPKHFAAYLEHVHYHEEESDPEVPAECGFTNLTSDEEDDDDSVTEIVDLSDSPRFTLPAFKTSRPHIIHFPTSAPRVSELCIFPNFHLFLEIYFRTAANYERSSFLRFYHAHQATYSLLSDSQFSQMYVDDAEDKRGTTKITSGNVLRDPQYPQGMYDPEIYQRHLEIGGAFALVEFKERSRRGIPLVF